MKKFITALSLSTFTLATNASVIYHCTGGSFDPVKVEFFSVKKIIINDKDVAKIDLTNPNLKAYDLIGTFSTLGDGAEGYSVDVKVTNYILRNAPMFYMNTYNRGPEGFYSDSYKCFKK